LNSVKIKAASPAISARVPSRLLRRRVWTITDSIAARPGPITRSGKSHSLAQK
jgi:hypothetical protein